MNTYKLEQFVRTDSEIVTNEANLSICLTAGGFIFAVTDKKFCLKSAGEFTVDLTGSIPQVMMNVKTCFSSIGIHIFNFNSVRIVCPSTRAVWMPYKLYDQSKNREYLSVSSPIFTSDTIISNVVQKVDAAVIFAFALHLYSGLKIVMPKAEFVCPSQVLVEYAFDISSFMQNTFVLNKRSDSCDYVIFKGNSFTLSNSFNYKTADDLLYFILYTLQQVDVNTAEVNLLLTGEKYTQEELNLFKRYVKHVSYANCTENITVPAEFDGVDLQKYFLVLA